MQIPIHVVTASNLKEGDIIVCTQARYKVLHIDFCLLESTGTGNLWVEKMNPTNFKYGIALPEPTQEYNVMIPASTGDQF